MAGTCFKIAREKMEKLIEAAGQEIINRAGEFAESVEQCTDLDIWIHFDNDEIPHIDVTKRYVDIDMIRVLDGTNE